MLAEAQTLEQFSKSCTYEKCQQGSSQGFGKHASCLGYLALLSNLDSMQTLEKYWSQYVYTTKAQHELQHYN